MRNTLTRFGMAAVNGNLLVLRLCAKFMSYAMCEYYICNSYIAGGVHERRRERAVITYNPSVWLRLYPNGVWYYKSILTNSGTSGRHLQTCLTLPAV